MEDQRVSLILEYTSVHFGVEVAAMKSSCRKKEIVAARHCAMFLIVTVLDYTLESTGELFGGRGHSTVMHALQNIDAKDSYAGNVQDVYYLKKELEAELNLWRDMKLKDTDIELTYGANEDVFGIYKMQII